MKKLMALLLALSLLCTLPLPAAVFAEDSDFQIDENGVLTKYLGSGGDVVIPDGISAIGEKAFKDCENLTSVVIPDGVTSIGKYAFSGCKSLTSVIIPNSVKTIDTSAFSSCTSLTNVKISDGISSIDAFVFENCSSLTNINIPDTVTTIGQYAFYDCRSLASITIPDTVTSIESNAFADCIGLASITIPDSVTKIGDGAFAGVGSIQANEGNENFISLDGNLYNKDMSVLMQYTGNGNFEIPDSVTSVPSMAFAYSGLTSVTIPDGITSIQYSTFKNCSNLTNISIPDTVTSIGGWAFSGCSSLTRINIPKTVTAIESYAFYNCSSLENIDIPDAVTSIEGFTFSGCSSLTSITIPDTVTSIGGWAFQNCSNLTSINIPDGITSIKSGTFSGCSSLTNISIPDAVTSIGIHAFSSCSSLASIGIPDTVTSIGNMAFAGCSSLTSITIPDTVTSIDAYVFLNCTNLETISFSGDAPALGKSAIPDSSSLTAYYPVEKKASYDAAKAQFPKVNWVSQCIEHDWGAWNVTKKPTATETGTAERICGNDSSHKDIKTLPALTDSTVWAKGARIEPTCENTGSQEYTSIYGTVTETLSAKGHAWGAWNVTKKPTATETGTAERICGNDSSHKDTATLPKLTDATVWTQGAYVAPTCENDGSREYTSTYGTVTETLSATGHAWGAWNVTKKPTATETGTAERICGNDSTHKDIKELPALTDSTVWTKGVRIEPTCENTGSQEYTSIYGTVTETLSATGHAWGAWNVTKKPTATETGTAERICGNDSTHKDIKELPALTDSTVWTKGVRIEPTCENTGSQEYTSIYGTVTETLSAMGHSFTVLQHDETKHWYKCERCEARSNEENHKGGQATKKEKATCSVCNAQYGKLLPDYALPADLKTTYGKALSDITLPTGWKWSDPSIVPTVTNNGYEAYYAIENEADYDWTNENGYDAAAKQIKLTLTVTVEKEKQKLSFEKSSINKYTTDSAFTNELTKTAVFGAVSFSSSDESVATVDNNGLITIKGTGTTDITALAAETDNYNAASATFTLNVTRRRSSSGGGERRGGASITITPGGAKNDGNQPGTDDWENPFIDVHESDWFYDSVKYVYINKMMNGVTSDMFAPEGNITRAMFVTVLYRMEKEPQAQASPFSDIAGGSYYEKAVAWANANGIVKGVSDAEFAPDESITREQMAAMIYRYAAYKKMDLSAGESTNILSYADYSDISDYAVSAMRYAAGNGIINGMTADTLSPKGISTRAQAAAVFMRVFNLFNK